MERIIFTGGQVLDGTGAPPARADVVVELDRIVEVGTALDGDHAVDVSGATLLPGCFDCHVHLTSSGDLDPLAAAQRPFSLRYYEAIANMRATLGTGVTSVRDAGGADLGVKRAVELGYVAGPRMQIAITMLSQTGGHADGVLPSGACLRFAGRYPGNPGSIVDGPEEMRRRVRELVRDGADVIKVATSGGVLSPSDEPTHAHFRDAELEMLVGEARAAGRFVMAHAQASDGIKAALRAGIRSIEHGIYLDEEAIELLITEGAWLVPTLSAPLAVLAAADAGVRLPEAVIRKAREVAEVHADSFGRAVAAGVKVAMGTDSGVGAHGRNLEELALMVNASVMSPIEAWVATTSSAARLLGVSDELGTIEPGKLADLVVLEGDCRDLAGLAKRVRSVVVGGAQVV
jgi:imidazolonepropionase-like amidohydrolase